MTCQECRDVMLEVARRRAAPFVERAVVAHAATCVECGRRLDGQRSLTAGLQALAADAAGHNAPAGVEARLLAVFAAQHQPAPGRLVRGGVRQWLPIAAALTLCAGGAAWWALAPRRHDVPVAPALATAAPGPAAVQPLPPAETARHTTPAPAQPRRAPARSARAAARPPVQAVGFVPIPSAAGLPDFESGEIVRMGIEVTALPNYGLEIPSGAQSTIQADFLVGQDGQARAIRLVNANAEGPRPRQ